MNTTRRIGIGRPIKVVRFLLIPLVLIVIGGSTALADPSDLPSAPGAPSVAENGLDTLTVSWAEPENSGSAITGYDLQYRKTTEEEWTDGPQDQTGTSAQITNLEGDRGYHVRVRAQNAEGEGEWSEQGSGTTALWAGKLTVGASGGKPATSRYLGLQRERGATNSFGDLSPQIVAYNGIEYQVIILSLCRGWRHDGNYNYHKTALDFYTYSNRIPDGWILRVRGTRFHTSEGIRATIGAREQKVYWTEPDISLSFLQKYDVALSREIDAPRDPDFDPLADLTAEFENVPERHDETAFSFRVRFSEEVEIGYRQFLDSVFELTGGVVTKARRLSPPGNARWEIGVRPSGAGDFTIALPANRPCAEAGAICTVLGKQLSLRVEETVSGPGEPVQQALTAQFENAPASHDGSSAFKFHLRFNEEVQISYRRFLDSVFTLSGGAVTKARRLAPPSNIGWEITMEPSGNNDVAIVLPADRNCTETGAICTGDGRKLSQRLELTVPGPGAAAPEVTGSTSFMVIEGDTAVATLTASDDDTPAADLTWSITGGADSAKFAITSAGALTLAAAKDFEAPDDADTDGIYEVTVRVSDGGRSDTANVQVTLSNRNEAPTAAAGVDQVGIEEGATVALSGTGEDPDAGDTLSYAWTQTGGPAVTLSAASSATTTFAAPTALAENATLAFRLRVTDAGGLYDEDAVSVTVVAEPPLPEVTVSAGTSPVTEGNAATFTVSLDSASPGALSVAVAVSETGNVLSGTAPSAVAFAAGERSKTLSLQTDDDDVDESDSTVKVSLATGSGYTLGSRSSAEVSVTDNDEAPGGGAWGERQEDRDIALGQSAKPTDLWSDGSKVWVITDWDTGQVRVYSLADGGLQSDLGFTLTGTVFPAALWSDGQTLWAADYSAGRVLAYRLSDGSRMSGQDFDQAVMSAAGNSRPSGLWSDGQTMWVADYSASKVFAYRLSDKARESAREFDLTSHQNGTPISPFGLWSDGETMLASDWQRGEIFAYTLSGGQRQPNRNIDTSESGTSYPSGLWSDGRTLWVVDDLAMRIYAYKVPGLGSTP